MTLLHICLTSATFDPVQSARFENFDHKQLVYWEQKDLIILFFSLYKRHKNHFIIIFFLEQNVVPVAL